MKLLTTICLTVAFMTISWVQAEPSNWDVSANTNFLISANTYSDNWTGGEAGAISWTWHFNLEAEKQLSEGLKNKNTLKLAFGQTHTQDQESKSWAVPEKSTDLIDFESILRVTLEKVVDPFASVRLLSQYLDGSDPTLDRYINPLDIIESFGGATDFIKKDEMTWNGRLGAGIRQLVDREKMNTSGVRETDITNEAGLEFVTELQTSTKSKNIEYKGNLRIFEALVSTRADETKGTPLEKDWRYPDLSFENILTVNLTKYLMLNLYAQMLYDREIDYDPRLKETLSLGLTYMITGAK